MLHRPKLTGEPLRHDPLVEARLRAESSVLRGLLPHAKIAVDDISAGLIGYRLAALLAWNDIKQRYRRSTIGPLWLTISMGVNIATIGLVFGSVFRTSIANFLPFVCLGLIFWGLILSMITEGSLSFIAADHIIKQTPLPLFTHVVRVYLRSTLILLHNLIIFPLLLLLLGKPLPVTALLSIPGFVLVSLNLIWMALFLAVLCTRYRDLPQIVASVVQIAFFVTPIIWMPGLVPHRQSLFLLDLNPMYHLLQIVRAPLLGEIPSIGSWSTSLLLAVVGWSVTIALFGRFQRRVAYWL
jgi:homopolymeric O-antigen transport system permease protein